jgi:hypothetical protein
MFYLPQLCVGCLLFISVLVTRFNPLARSSCMELRTAREDEVYIETVCTLRNVTYSVQC